MIPLSVGVIPRKEFRSYSRGGALMDTLPLEEAFERLWDTPALFCTYYVEDEPRWPRLAKRDLRTIETKGKGVFVHSLVFDYDLRGEGGGKREWTGLEESIEVLTRVADAGLLPTVWYTTLHGARLVYRLQTAVLPHDAERAYQAMLRRLAAAGVDSDTQTTDWTRFFALPRITKEDGILTWDDPNIYVEYFPEQVLHASVLLADAPSFSPLRLDEAQPSVDEVERLLYTMAKSSTGALVRKQTPQHRASRVRLKNSPWLPQVEGNPCDFQPGERDSLINRMVWSVTKSLWGRIDEMEPQLIYALLHAAVQAIEPDDDHPDWTAVLWEKVQRIWEQHHDQEQAERLSQQEIEARVVAGFKDHVRKSKSHLPTLMARAGIDNELEFCRRHLVAVLGGEMYPIDETGNYLPTPVARGGLHGTVQTMGLSDLYGLFDRDGKSVSVDELLREHGVSVCRAEGRLGLRRAQLRGFPDDLHLLLPTYHRIEVQGEFVQEVDDWLHNLVGDNYDRLADWLGHAQDIYRPICALSLSGSGGAGKSFLAELLAKRFGPGHKSTEQCLGDWNSGLAGNPVIHIDEGIGTFRSGKAVDEVFRTYVGGGFIEVREKYRVSRVCEVYPRVVIVANDLEALQKTISGRDLNDASHEALASRVLHLQVRPEASGILCRDVTYDWISGPKLALKHLAWLYDNRTDPSPWSGRGRFLVEGDRHSEVLEEARFSTPLMQAVMTTIVRCVESTGNIGAGIELDTDAVIKVNTNALLEALNRRVGMEFYDLKGVNHRTIGSALRKLGHEKRVGTKRYHEVPVGRILIHAIRHGLECGRLTEAYERQNGQEALTALQRDAA